ncbi:hypothetical protein [Actinoalloteichus spitiensis]|nr:hypothetical protein [Actinoalloteichus spitiensis]
MSEVTKYRGENITSSPVRRPSPRIVTGAVFHLVDSAPSSYTETRPVSS